MYLSADMILRGLNRVDRLLPQNKDLYFLRMIVESIKKLNAPIEDTRVVKKIIGAIYYLNGLLDRLVRVRDHSISNTKRFEDAMNCNDAILDIIGCNWNTDIGFLKAIDQISASLPKAYANGAEASVLHNICFNAEKLIKSGYVGTKRGVSIRNLVPSHVKGHKKLGIGRLIYSSGTRSYFVTHAGTNVPVCTKHAFAECSKSELADYLWSDSQALKKDVVCPRCAAAADDQ